MADLVVKDLWVIQGSENDADKTNMLLEIYQALGIIYRVSTASCHRNIGGPFERQVLAIDTPLIVMIGGLELAAPGIISSILRNAERNDQVVIGVPLDKAARSAIENLPMGTPVFTFGLNEISLRHSLVNAALGSAQLAGMLGRKAILAKLNELYRIDRRFSKPLVPEIELVNGLIPIPQK